MKKMAERKRTAELVCVCDKCDRAQITMTCAVKNICIKEGEVCWKMFSYIPVIIVLLGMPQKVCVAISSIILLHKTSSVMSVDSNAVLYSGLACMLVETLPVSFRLNKSLSLSFRGGLQQTSWTRVFLEPTDHFDVESATYKEHRVSQLSSQITWRKQLLDANLVQRLCSVCNLKNTCTV